MQTRLIIKMKIQTSKKPEIFTSRRFLATCRFISFTCFLFTHISNSSLHPLSVYLLSSPPSFSLSLPPSVPPSSTLLTMAEHVTHFVKLGLLSGRRRKSLGSLRLTDPFSSPSRLAASHGPPGCCHFLRIPFSFNRFFFSLSPFSNYDGETCSRIMLVK